VYIVKASGKTKSLSPEKKEVLVFYRNGKKQKLFPNLASNRGRKTFVGRLAKTKKKKGQRTPGESQGEA